MNSSAAVGGRQMQRSGHQHQRQYSSDQLLVDSFPSGAGGSGKWSQNLSSPGFSSSQQVEYSRMLRSAQRGMNGEFMLSMDSSPLLSLRSSSQRKAGDVVSPSELSPGILDLQSFDTELLTDIAAPGFYDGGGRFGNSRDRSFDELETGIYSSKQFGKATSTTDGNLPKSFALEKDKPGSVAKIKVVVRKRPLNKKEISKKEDDIIAIEQHTNSLTVYETKLKNPCKCRFKQLHPVAYFLFPDLTQGYWTFSRFSHGAQVGFSVNNLQPLHLRLRRCTRRSSRTHDPATVGPASTSGHVPLSDGLRSTPPCRLFHDTIRGFDAHGPNECLLNTIEACAISAWPELTEHFKFIYCVENLVLKHKYRDWESCFQETGLNSGAVFDCYHNGNGKKLELKYAAQTDALQPPHKYVPWVVVNGQPLYEDYEDFEVYICEAYRGDSPPKTCTSLTVLTTKEKEASRVHHVSLIDEAL